MPTIEHVGPLRSPYPYFGGKSRVASLIWSRLGDPGNFIEPFFGELLKVAAEIQGKAARFIRIGASGPVLRHHLPRALRQVRKDLRKGDRRTAHEALDLVLQAIKALEIPHLEWEDESDQVVH